MVIHQGEQRVTLSVREFAEFRIGAEAGGRGYSPTRAALGTAWHTTLRERLEASTDAARFEVALQATLLIEGWRIELSGRIDQVQEQAGQLILREVKTVDEALPQEPEDLLASYPTYACQAALYELLYPLAFPDEPRPCAAELLFVAIGDGLTQAVPLEGRALSLVRQQFERLRPFLENRKNAQKGWRGIRPAFAEARPGQPEALEALHYETNRAPIVFFEAPTGFGKTGILLEHSLRKMANGEVDRLVYVTSKSTGQLEVARQLEQMLGDPGAPRFFCMRGKAEHAFGCPLNGCDTLGRCIFPEENLASVASVVDGILANAASGLAPIHAAAESIQVCPYTISRSVLPFADVWIGDFNYLFSPHHRNVYFGQPGFDPFRTLLLVDEAHNLASRVEDAWSAAASVHAMEAALVSLRTAGVPPSLVNQWENLCDWLETLEPTPRLPVADEYAVADLVESLVEELVTVPPDYDLLSPEAVEQTRNLHALHAILHSETVERLVWCRERGVLQVSCLNAAQEIAATVQPFAQTLFMSATMQPFDLFSEETGLARAKVGGVVAEAPWQEGACEVAIDLRPDTRFKSRRGTYAMTAQTIAQLRNSSATAVAAFFSSYKYAEEVAAYLRALEFSPRVVIQPRGLSLNAQREFIEEAILTQDVLCLVLGSGFSEGIDLLGGKVESAIVVGPALPEANAVQQARLDALAHLGREEAFRRVYIVPALRKVNQALGRLVRAPGQRAKILLHGRRFAQPEYRELLAPTYQTDTEIHDVGGLLQWLSQ